MSSLWCAREWGSRQNVDSGCPSTRNAHQRNVWCSDAHVMYKGSKGDAQVMPQSSGRGSCMYGQRRLVWSGRLLHEKTQRLV